MGIALEIAKIAREEAVKNGAEKVVKLGLTVGRWSGVEPETLRFALEAVFDDALLKGCEVGIEITEPTFDCMDCGKRFTAESRFDMCPGCGSAGGPLVCGDELTISHLEVED